MEWASQRAVYQALRVPEKYHAKAGLGSRRERESLGCCCKNSGRAGGAAVRPKVDTMVWSKSFGVSDMRDKQGVPCNLPEALLRNPNCWPLGTRTSTHAGVVKGTRSLSGIKRTPGQAGQACCGAGPRCWPATVGGVVLVVVMAAEAAATGSPISNLKSQIPIEPSNPPMCVSAARKGGPQTIQAENSDLPRHVGVDYCCCTCCVLFAPVLETRRA